MAKDRRMELNNLLCFTTCKFSRVALKPLKCTIMDFYSSDDITAAKELLQVEAEALKYDKLVKLPRRRKDSISKVNGEIDDIMNLIASLDEGNHLHRLPLFVASDPDCMPSIKLTDGDLSVMLAKLDKMDNNIESLNQQVGESNRKLNHLAMRPSDRNHIDLNLQALRNSSRNAQATASEASDNSDADRYEIVEGKRKRKKANSPNNALPNYVSFADKVKRGPTLPVKKVPIQMSGIASTSTSTLKASGSTFLEKAVYCLNNIDSSYMVSDVSNYITSIGVRIFTCFELKSAANRPTDRKSFRICVAEADKAKLLDGAAWAVGITIRAWVRKADTFIASASAKSAELHQNSSDMDCSSAVDHADSENLRPDLGVLQGSAKDKNELVSNSKSGTDVSAIDINS